MPVYIPARAQILTPFNDTPEQYRRRLLKLVADGGPGVYGVLKDRRLMDDILHEFARSRNEPYARVLREVVGKVRQMESESTRVPGYSTTEVGLSPQKARGGPIRSNLPLPRTSGPYMGSEAEKIPAGLARQEVKKIESRPGRPTPLRLFLRNGRVIDVPWSKWRDLNTLTQWLAKEHGLGYGPKDLNEVTKGLLAKEVAQRRKYEQWANGHHGATVIPFGKFEGKTLDELTETQEYYLAALHTPSGHAWMRQAGFAAFSLSLQRYMSHPGQQAIVREYGESTVYSTDEGYSPRDRQPHFDPYRPETWEHPFQVVKKERRGHMEGFDPGSRQEAMMRARQANVVSTVIGYDEQGRPVTRMMEQTPYRFRRGEQRYPKQYEPEYYESLDQEELLNTVLGSKRVMIPGRRPVEKYGRMLEARRPEWIRVPRAVVGEAWLPVSLKGEERREAARRLGAIEDMRQALRQLGRVKMPYQVFDPVKGVTVWKERSAYGQIRRIYEEAYQEALEESGLAGEIRAMLTQQKLERNYNRLFGQTGEFGDMPPEMVRSLSRRGRKKAPPWMSELKYEGPGGGESGVMDAYGRETAGEISAYKAGKANAQADEGEGLSFAQRMQKSETLQELKGVWAELQEEFKLKEFYQTQLGKLSGEFDELKKVYRMKAGALKAAGQY